MRTLFMERRKCFKVYRKIILRSILLSLKFKLGYAKKLIQKVKPKHPSQNNPSHKTDDDFDDGLAGEKGKYVSNFI